MTHDHKDGCCGSKSAAGATATQGTCNTNGCCRRNWVSIVAVVVALLAVGYAFMEKRNAGDMGKPKVDTSALITGEDSVIAKVNGQDVHRSDVAMAIRELGANVPPESVDQIIPAFLDQYINLQLINEAARKAGTAKDSDVRVQLASSREQIIRAAYMRKMFDGKFTEEALKEAYKAKFEDKPMADEVRARHILVDDEAKAKDLIKQINAGANFEKLAAENSKDPSSARGGDLGYFVQSEMVKEFGEAAFALKAGQVTQQPVKSQFGFHIIKAEDRRPRVKPSFEEARGPLEQEIRQQMLDAKLAELRADAKIEILTAKQGEAAPAEATAETPADATTEEAAPAADVPPAPTGEAGPTTPASDTPAAPAE